QAEDGIRDFHVTGVQTCALPISFATGLLFGLGLILSGMSNPAKVLGFLDLAGAWDPSLALVMAGAVLIGFVAFRLAGRCQCSLRSEERRVGEECRAPWWRRDERA